MSTTSAAAIATWANDLVCDAGDSTLLTQFVTDLASDELPQLPDGWNGTTNLLAVTAGTATVTVATDVRKIAAVFYGGHELSRETWASLDALMDGWQDRLGAPRAYTAAREEERTLRLYPVPNITSSSTASAVSETDRLVLLVTVATDLPLFLKLPAALWALSREYARESDHRDLEFAKGCREWAMKMLKMADGEPWL